MRFAPLLVGVCLVLSACATPENRREQYGAWYPYQPIPYSPPLPGDSTYPSPRETTIHYGPDQEKLIVGTWGEGGHRPSMEYPSTPQTIERRIISRYNTPGLRAQEIADRALLRH
jgi:hypothetical protein|tara:strand:- start:139 stop:483 length:345 start_codon:yes stop_codon:yes gene_type:complete